MKILRYFTEITIAMESTADCVDQLNILKTCLSQANHCITQMATETGVLQTSRVPQKMKTI